MSCISTSCAPSMSVAQGFRSAEPEKGSNAPTSHNTAQRAASHTQSRENTGQDMIIAAAPDNIEDGVSSSSNLSDRHVGSRRNSTSSWSTCGSVESWPHQDFFPTIRTQDSATLENPLDILASEFELVIDERPPLHEIDRAALRGEGLSLEYIPKSIIQLDPSEITDPRLLPSSSSNSGSLQNRLLLEHCRHPLSNRIFISTKRLESLIQPQNVVKELTRCLRTPYQQRAQDFARQICATSNTKEKSFQKVFAILITIEKVDSITEFLHEGVHDGDLPLMRLHRDGREGVFDFGRRPKEGKASHPLKCFESFSLMNFENFDQYQWAMLAPIFRHTCQESAKCYEFHDKIIIPFIEEEGVSEGGFGRVSRVKIHPDHHEFGNSKTSNNQFAVKRLKSHDKQVFRAEFDMLSKFSKNTHPHLISLLAAYTHQKSFHFLFPWAEADLAIFWRKIKPKPRIEEAVLWVARQCAGIADGLSKIHEYNSFCGDGAADTTQGFTRQSGGIKLYGRHGDIKPANILWFSNLEDANDGGTLKLTDFGLAEFHTMDSRSNRARRQIGTSDVYRPPEYDMPDGKISRSYDIWTIGCLYLEFIAWLLGGWDLVRLFNIKRTPLEATWCLDRCDYTFFELEGKSEMPRVKRTVTEFIRIDLHGHQACTQYLHEFIDLIEEELLLVETGKTNSKRRIECGPLCSRLNKMYEQCAKDREYAIRPTPWMKNL